MPTELGGEHAKAAWDQIQAERQDHFSSNFSRTDLNKLWDIFSRNCVIYFPANRFEEPAWLNEENLKSHAEYMDLTHTRGYTNRKVINYSSLRENQNWLFDLAYDQFVIEGRLTKVQIPFGRSGQVQERLAMVNVSGKSSLMNEIARMVVQEVVRNMQGATFKIGPRQNRVVSLQGSSGNIVPNIFQLSSGETALLNLFISILRDFDLSGATFSEAGEIKGVVVVDEIDLHLHAVHQHEILPGLMRMFPKVQFIVTTHSPLFVLGMAERFGEEGFAVYRMPEGQQISPEEFAEFGAAYQAFTATSKFADDIRVAVKDAQSPILYMEGETDVKYLKRAAELLGQQWVIEGIEVRPGGGIPGLKTIWSTISKLPVDLVVRKVVLLYDCDHQGTNETVGSRFRRKIPRQDANPINKGIENLFAKATLEKGIKYKPEFIDIDHESSKTVRGELHILPEKWIINDDEKTNLCNWLCENGTDEDFRHFQVIFDLLEETLGNPNKEVCNSA